MDRQKLTFEIISGRGGPMSAVMREALTAPACLYSLIVSARRRAYRSGLLRAVRAQKPVICIGNITTGGTGKTPMVAWVVELLKKHNRRPAILTRGYKSSGGVSDEAELLKAECGAQIFVGSDRAASAARAAAEGADCLVMDDGFQHLHLARDLNIILIDATNPFGFGRPLPAGLLRELPREALVDADAIVITRSDLISPARLENLSLRLAAMAPRASIHRAEHKPVAVVDRSGREDKLDSLKNKKIFAFCGLANPEAFFQSLAQLGAVPIQTLTFDDHCPYGADLLAQIKTSADRCKPDLIVCTQKDMVKLKNAELPAPLAALKIQMDVTAGREILEDKILSVTKPR